MNGGRGGMGKLPFVRLPLAALHIKFENCGDQIRLFYLKDTV